MQIKPIETDAFGQKFRSRAEARWAQFFEAGHIRYVYEPEGFESDGIRYLPDFYLPDFDLYVEVKPERPEAGEELKKPLNMVMVGIIKRLLILQDMPPKTECDIYWYPFAYYHNGYQGIRIGRAVITPAGDGLGTILIRTDLYPGYEAEVGFAGFNCANARNLNFKAIHDKDMQNNDGFPWRDTLDHEMRREIGSAYDKARKARF